MKRESKIEPKRAKGGPKGTKREPTGAKREPQIVNKSNNKNHRRNDLTPKTKKNKKLENRITRMAKTTIFRLTCYEI